MNECQKRISKLMELRWTLEEIARECELSTTSVFRIYKGITRNPYKKTEDKILSLKIKKPPPKGRKNADIE